MEQSFADLLTDAFSETSLPSFPDGELEFESLYFDEKFEEDKTGSSHKNLTILTEEDEALHQEATGQTEALFGSLETNDINKAENDDKQETDTKNDKEEVHCESSDGDPEEVEKEDRGMGEKPEGWSMSVHCGEEFWDRDKEDRIFAKGPLAPEGTGNPQVRNEEQGESECDEDMSYFGSVPKRGSGMIMLQVDGIEDKEQQREEERLEDSTDTEFEGIKIEKDEVKEDSLFTRYFPQEDEDHQTDGFIFELPEVLMQNLQDLIADDDSEEDVVDKMKDFSGEDHQEAGESFADYPSDFSSCEYMEDGRKNQESQYKLKVLPCTSGGSNMKQNTHLESGATEITWMGSAVDTEEKENLDTGWIGIDDVKIAGLDLTNEEIDNRDETEIVTHISGNASVKGCDYGDEISEPMCLDAKGTTYTEEEEGPDFYQYQYNSDSDTSARRHQSESDTYSSSDDEIQVRSDEESTDNICHRGPENNEPLEDARPHRENRAALCRGNMSDDLAVTNDCRRRDLAACSMSWDTDITTTEALWSEDLLLSTEDTDKEETLPSDVNPITAELVPVDIHSGEDTTIPSSNQGSVDDCFFFNSEYEASRVTELGQFGDDEYEEERNWEQERERIKAFYKFYNDGEGENGKEGRKIKVQFCTDPLSQVIHYDTDSSDRESLNSSTEGEEDLSSADNEPRECETLKMNSAPHPTHNLLPEHVPDLSNTQLRTRKHKCLGILKLILKMGLVILMGLLMLWWATIQLDWLGHVAFF